MLTITACGKTESSPESVPQSASGYIPPVASSPPDSSSEDSESGMESSSETSDTSSESEPPSVPECPYKVGDLIGPEDLPSRGRAAYIVTVTSRDAETGNVRLIERHVYDKYDNVLALFGRSTEYYYSYEYDEDGNITREYQDSAGDYEDNEYKDGLMSKYTVFKDGEAQYECEFFYDEHGTLVKNVTHFFSDDSTSTVIDMKAEYDDRGNLSRAVYFNSSGEESEIDVLEYNENNECVKFTRTMRLNTDKEYTVTETYTYDDRGNTLSHYFINVAKDGTIRNEYREEFVYNSDNRKTEERDFNFENGVEKLKVVTEYEFEI